MLAPPDYGEVLVPSFTEEGKVYRVDPERGTCTCRRFEVKRTCVKHIALAEALTKMPSRRDLLPTEDRIATERLFGLAKRIYAPAFKRKSRYRDVVDAYDLYLEISGYRCATERLVEAARARHKGILAEHLEGAA